MCKYGVLAAALLFNAPVLAWNCSEDRTIETQFDIGSIREIRVEAGAGELSIKGADQADAISIVAKLCASDEDLLAQMDVKTKLEGDFASVVTSIPKTSSGNYSSRIDLSLIVPNDAKLDVKDSSGDVDIKGVAELKLVDSSGDIEVKNINGSVNLTDSSGGVRISKIGSGQISDSSGSIDVRDVAKDFTVNVDSSGDMEISGVGGDLLIKVDSSGSIDVEDISGNFTVEKDGSGGIRFDDVQGEVTIPRRKM